MLSPEAPGNSVVLLVRTELSDDVVEGIRLYCRVAGNDFDEGTVRTRWLRWNCQNPHGFGYFVLAKDGDRVVGCYGVIPILMRLGGRNVIGGKGEYQVVDPSYLKATDPTEKCFLPQAIVNRAFREAQAHGIEALHANPSPSAQFSIYKAGALPVKTKIRQYVAFSNARKFAWPGVQAHRRSLLIAIAGRAATAVCRAFFSLARWPSIRRYAVQQGGFPETLPLPEGNQALASTREMLDFRYPREDYVLLRLQRAGADVALFVLSRPRRNGMVLLSHWEPWDLPPEQWCAGLNAAFQVCRRSGATLMIADVPASVDVGLLRKTGFLLRQTKTTTLFVFSRNENLCRSRDQGQWCLTNSHLWLYQDR